ncbi:MULTISPECIES: hypothetical protein [unclassified Colwellia]|uniref:hypothetical protein n=1 Tax=unclassified Colwellia TaxID=196834 RepID=UPI0015F3F4C7|nr:MULTISPECIES: hypothetical protein [unclassified Colwellia]MBA6233975.1 hypothetical protein [Colwellia sp. MB02u-7]MBA6236961.1 hypothetical protein [Colwellia sp. MB02u-11]MBA6300649.1 hypothetical protein [Colwellia sp. MB3u-22]MBA6310592.1 hypothetical protein [Colwellia sp. MB3u-64]
MALDLSKIFLKRPLLYFDFTKNLMQSFISQTEETIQGSIDKFKAEGPEDLKIEIDASENIYQYTEIYMGLDSHSVELDDIFTSHFPSLQRRSAFLTLFGTYEHEIEKLCSNYAKKHDTNINLSDIKGNGLDRSHLFIKKVIGLNESVTFSILRKIVKLRNTCAHNDARYIENDGQEIKEIRSLLTDQNDIFSEDGKQVLFHNGALKFVLDSFNAYIKEIETALKKR